MAFKRWQGFHGPFSFFYDTMDKSYLKRSSCLNKMRFITDDIQSELNCVLPPSAGFWRIVLWIICRCYVEHNLIQAKYVMLMCCYREDFKFRDFAQAETYLLPLSSTTWNERKLDKNFKRTKIWNIIQIHFLISERALSAPTCSSTILHLLYVVLSLSVGLNFEECDMTAENT